MNSKQEKLVNLFSHTLTGAPSVFAPDLYGFSNKQKTDEPADIVWHYEKFVLLMYMTSTEKVFQDESLIEIKRQKQIKHNLKQAKKWLNHWRVNKIPLCGKNEFQTFNIPYTNDLKVMVISIYEIGTKNGYIEIDFTIKNNIPLCISLPESAIRLLSELEATPLDICWIFTAIVNIGVPSPFDAHEIILNHFRPKTKDFYPEFQIINYQEMKSTIETIKKMRSKSVSLKHFEKLDLTILIVLNDLLHQEFLMIAEITDKLIVEHGKKFDSFKTVIIPLNHYLISVTICSLETVKTNQEKLKLSLEKNKQLSTEQDKDAIHFFFCGLQPGSYDIIGAFTKTRNTHINKLLKNCVASQPNYEALSNKFSQERRLLKLFEKQFLINPVTNNS
ncbi:hypothetical protein [Arcicella rosea]|uniref:Uncharacterized protein n=1 Tax=Arcicella rosea TaxID=502909 RepID=A0A841EPP1_9BACT|nr:hypothetical protein [Arcicella rosea]MBB6003349.1 hypothetical protein [Arcicella rosea]